MRTTILILFVAGFMFSCVTKEKKLTQKPDTEEINDAALNNGWEEIKSSIVTFDSFDGDRILESGQAFFVAENLLVTQYSLVSRATRIVFSPLGENEKFVASKFVAVDRINDLIVLQTDSLKRQPIQLFTDSLPSLAKTFYISTSQAKVVQLFTGKVLEFTNIKGNPLYSISNPVRKSTFGMPIFVSNKQVIGSAFSATVSYKMQSFVIPARFISALFDRRAKTPVPLKALRENTDMRVTAENKSIKGLVLETDAGNITIRLFDETPEYRDNFIKLTKEGYFDNLLIHRVIADFGIQSGAADTRFARKGDMIGFKGPGYTLPAHFNTGLFHKRGMIGSPRKPDTSNERLRSDGSQFYIVTGRKYSDAGLDELEKENDYKFSAEQREVYKTIGGAPHLDGSYTIFGEVIDGMDIADEIVKVETDKEWRPLKDIRLKKVKILK